MSIQRRMRRQAARKRKPDTRTPVQSAIDQAEYQLTIDDYPDKAAYCAALGTLATMVYGAGKIIIDPESAHVPHFDGPHPEQRNALN